MVSDMDVMFSCIFNLRDVCMRIAITCRLYCTQGLPQGSSLKKKSVSGSSFIRGKSVKEELITNSDCPYGDRFMVQKESW